MVQMGSWGGLSGAGRFLGDLSGAGRFLGGLSGAGEFLGGLSGAGAWFVGQVRLERLICNTLVAV